MWALYVGHGLLIGLVGNGAIFAPLVIYVTRWFDRRRGSALALISSGQYIAGVVWPSVFERGIALYGWQTTMLAYSAVVVVVILPLTLLCLRPVAGGARHTRAVQRSAQGRIRYSACRPIWCWR